MSYLGGQKFLDKDRRDYRHDADQVYHYQRGRCLCKTALQGFKGV